MQRTGTRIDYLKIARELKISRHTVKEYIEFIESTYFIKRLTPFIVKVKIQKSENLLKFISVIVALSGILCQLMKEDFLKMQYFRI